MALEKRKILAVVIIAGSIALSGWGGYGINYDTRADILLASQTTAKNNSQTTPKTTTPAAATQSTVKNSGNEPNKPRMPLMPTNPAESSAGTSSVLKRAWESGQDQPKSEQLKTLWETRKNTVLSGKGLKIKTNMETKKRNIHQEAKGKSSKTEIKAAD